jgi:hypothetical protein
MVVIEGTPKKGPPAQSLEIASSNFFFGFTSN